MKKGKYGYRLLVAIIFWITLIFISAGVSQAQTLTEFKIPETSYSQLYKQWLQLSDEEKQTTMEPYKYDFPNNNRRNLFSRSVGINTSIPSKFDLRNTMNLNVHNQGSTNSCWAFSTLSSLETNLKLKQNLNYDLSERYLDYISSQSFLNNENNPYGGNRKVTEGGNSQIAYAYLTNGKAAIKETDMPFQDTTDTIDLRSLQNKQVVAKVDEYILFDAIDTTKDTIISVQNTRNAIKQHVMENGAVYTNIYSPLSGGGKYYNPVTYAAYCNDTTKMIDHAVSIVGWDDNYSKDNFGIKPKNNGAYLVKNSWDTTFGENGYYYISYEDVFVEKTVTGIATSSEIDYDTIYQHDMLGYNQTIYVGTSKLYGANVFTRTKSTPEVIDKISVVVPMETYCKVYINPKSSSLNKNDFIEVTGYTPLLKAGYHTIELDKQVTLNNSQFTVMVEYYNPTGPAYISVEKSDSIGFWSNIDNTKTGESFATSSLDSKWTDLSTLQSNNCIKAFTKDLNIFSNMYTIDAANKYISKISPQTKISDFLHNITITGNSNIKDKNGTIVSNNQDILKTGMTLSLDSQMYTLIVRGDINGDGKITLMDLSKLALHLVEKQMIKEPYTKGADISLDNKITLLDLSQISRYLVGLINF